MTQSNSNTIRTANYTISEEMLSLIQATASNSVVNHKNKPNCGNTKKSVVKNRHDSKQGHNGKADPIKEKEDIEKAKSYFLNQSSRFKSSHTNLRNYMLFILGLNTGRRVGDLLKLKVGDFLMSCNKYENDYLFRTHIGMKEEKTGKHAKVVINDSCKEAISKYLDSLKLFTLNDFLFVSRNGGHLKYDQALNIYKQMAKDIGLTDKGLNIGTHSARKTLGYQWMKQGENEHNPVALAQLQMFYNHSNPNVTLSYTGITQEEQDNMIKGLCL